MTFMARSHDVLAMVLELMPGCLCMAMDAHSLRSDMPVLLRDESLSIGIGSPVKGFISSFH